MMKPLRESVMATRNPQGFRKVIADLVWALTAMFDSYRPELHYMRGPGPKWHEKHVHG